MLVKKIPLKQIRILENIRANINDGDLADLMATMNNDGLLQPIGVYRADDSKQDTPQTEYIISWGHKRFLSARKLGWVDIDAVILPEKLTEEQFLILNAIENIHRTNNNPVELGMTMQRLRDIGNSVGEIAVKLSIPKTRVLTCLRIVGSLPKKYMNSVRFFNVGNENKKGKLPATVINIVMSLRIKKDEYEQILDEIKKEELSLDDVRLIAELIGAGYSVKDAIKEKDKFVVKTCKAVIYRDKLTNLEKSHQTFTSYVKELLIKQKMSPKI